MSNHLLAITCVLLSSKFYEPDENLIMTFDLKKKFGRTFISKEDYKRAELRLMDILDWNMLIQSPLDYIQLFETLGLLQSDDVICREKVCQMNSQDLQRNCDRVNFIAENLADWSINKLKFSESYNQSELATVLVMLSRRMIGIKDMQNWNPLKLVGNIQKELYITIADQLCLDSPQLKKLGFTVFEFEHLITRLSVTSNDEARDSRNSLVNAMLVESDHEEVPVPRQSRPIK